MKINMYSIWLFVLASAFVFSSCTEENENLNSISIEGTLWTETSYVESGCNNPADDESGNSVCTATECSQFFMHDGQLVIMEKDGGQEFKVVGSYQLTASTITVNVFNDNIIMNYTLEGNTLTLNMTDDSDGCESTVTYEGEVQADPAAYLASIMPNDLSLEGTTWTQQDRQASGCDDPADDGSNSCSSDCTVLEFTDGTFNMYEYEAGQVSNTVTGTYIIDSPTTFSVSFNEGGQTITLDFDYYIIDDILTLDFFDEFNGCDVIESYQGEPM